MNADLKIFSGSSNIPLAQKICDYLGIQQGQVFLKEFATKEPYCQYLENIRGGDIFLLQSCGYPANDLLMEHLIMCDAARRSSAGRITSVLSYFPFNRQDRKDKGRTPISARLVLDLLQAAGVDRILTLDLHTLATQAMTNTPLDSLFATQEILEELKDIENPVVVAPDLGAVKRANIFAQLLGVDLCITTKQRISDQNVEFAKLIGDVKGKNVIIIDDLSESIGTLNECARVCLEQGARSTIACITHNLLNEKAESRIKNECYLSKLIFTNSVNNKNIDFSSLESYCTFKHVDVAPLFGKAIDRIHNNKSISSLFNFDGF